MTDQDLKEHLRVDQGLSEIWTRSILRRKDKFLRWLEERDRPTDPEKITKMDLREYFDYTKENYASQTVRKRLTAIKKFMRYHDIDLMKNMRFSVPPDGRVDRPYYSQEQASKIWKTAQLRGPRDLALISLNLGMGLRNIGAHRLKWRDIDLEDRTMTVTGKSKKKRDLRIPRRVTRNLKSYKDQTMRTWKTWKKEIDRDLLTPKIEKKIPIDQPPEYLFTNDPEESLNLTTNFKELPESEIEKKLRYNALPWTRPRTNTLTEWLNRILDQAEIPDRDRDGFRAGRRRFGRDLYMATGYDVRTVSQYLGHESPSQTLEYLQLESYDQKKAIDQLDGLLENLIMRDRPESARDLRPTKTEI